MRLQGPQLPPAPDKDQFGKDLVFKVKQILTSITNQVNSLTEGAVSAITNATTQAPTAGSYQQGDFIRNKQPTVLGSAGAHYIVTGWTCVQAGTPGVWVETRSPTGT